MRRGIRSLVLVGALTLALVGCAGLPMTGAVHEGLSSTAEPDVPDVQFKPNGPQAGATPEQIVDGFLNAGSGPAGGWATAREFLTGTAVDGWRPDAGATVDVLSARSIAVASSDQSSATVTVSLSPTATVDGEGAYTAVAEAAAPPLTFTLSKQSAGWRITSAPNGIVLDQDLFKSVFRAYSLMYYDPTWTFLVPDVRWFPTLNASTRIAAALINGQPSPWLAKSVVSAFPETVSLGSPSVPVVNGVAQVDLKESALTSDQTTLSRMQAQLTDSLASTGQVTSVTLSIAGSALDVTPAPSRDTRVDSRTLALTAKGFGFIAAGQVDELPGVSAAVAALSPRSVELSDDRTTAAVLAGNGAVTRVDAAGPAALDQRAGLIAPSIDPFGYIWSVPQTSPSALVAAGTGATRIAISSPWGGASRVDALQVSRDGTRIAALVISGGRSVLMVAGVVRDAQGVPKSLGDAVTLLSFPAGASDAAWLDESTLGVISGSGSSAQFTTVQIGGVATTADAPPGAVAIAGVNVPTIARVLDSNGTVFIRSGTTWQQDSTGVSVLGTQQGSPLTSP
jgi:hypothetical protein